MHVSDRVEYDVLLVGGSPSNLALAHRLLDRAKETETPFSLAILEKGRTFGANIISGAVSNPRVVKKLFPDYLESGFPLEGVCRDSRFAVLGSQKKWEVPNPLLPKGLHKEGYLILTLSHVVGWMAAQLEEKAATLSHVQLDMFPGFSAHQIVYEGDRVVGVQVVEKSTGTPDEDNIYGKVVCFGDKGFLSRDLIDKFNLRDNPQIWSVGVKEVWELPEGKDFQNRVWHTMGYPLMDGTFGGGFVYGMKDRKLTIGLIASLDSPNPNLNPQQRLQDYKKHPWIQDMIRGGKLLKYGAAVLPEGGLDSLPKRFAVDGALMLGDALGILDVSCLSGVDKAMESGYIAADLLFDQLKSGGSFSAAELAPYQEKLMAGFVGKELREGRYFRLAWQENPRLLNQYLPTVVDGIDGPGPMIGLVSVGLKHNPVQALQDALRLKTCLEGNTNLGPVRYTLDYQHIVPDFKSPASISTNGHVDKATIYSRPDAVFFADPHYHEENKHIDEFNADVCLACIKRYDGLNKDVPCVSDCTAEVHRVDVVSDLRRHGMSLENCIQCRTCEIVCPEVNLRVRPTEQGAGPDFTGL